MKIEPNSPPIKNQQELMPSQKTAAGSSSAKTPSENKSHKQSSQIHIINWFSQAGVQQENSSFKTPTSNEKIRRKKEVLAQRKLYNLEKIMGKALDFCLDDSKDEDLDPDWFFSFLVF